MKRKIPALTASALAILTLAACSQNATVPQASTAPATTASAPAETRAPDDTAAPAELTTGAAVTDQATIDACQPIGVGIVAYGDLADGKCPLPTGTRLFPMADGSHVVVNQDDPLPEAVTADVQATAKSTGAMDAPDAGFNTVTGTFIQEMTKRTGKSVVVISSITGANGSVTYAAMKSYNETYMGIQDSTKATPDEAYQAGLAFVAGQAYPDRWVVIPYAG